MKVSFAVILAGFATETLASFVQLKRTVKKATLAIYSGNDESSSKEGPWLRGEVDGNGHIIDSNLPERFRKLQMNYESDCKPTWKRSPKPPKTTADFLEHLESVRIGEEVGKPVKQNVMGVFEKPTSSWISQVPRRPLEGDISAYQAASPSDEYSSVSPDFRTKYVPGNRPSSASPWIDYKPRKPLEGDFSVYETNVEEKRNDTSSESLSTENRGPFTSHRSTPFPFVATPTPFPVSQPGVAARFSSEYHSGHHPSWFQFSTSDALIEGSTLKRIRITEQSPFYLKQPSNISNESMATTQDTISAQQGFVDAEFEEDELAAEVTRLREMALEAAEEARVAEMEAAEKAQQARKASEDARFAELHAVEKAVAARDAAQTARLALENLRKVREEEAARLAEEARLEALREKEEQARLEALAKKRELARQEAIALQMRKEQEALLEKQRERARQEEIALQVRKEQEALMQKQRERARQEEIALEMRKEQEELLEMQRERARQDDLIALGMKKEHESFTETQNTKTPDGAGTQSGQLENEMQSESEMGKLREEFRLAQIAKKKKKSRATAENTLSTVPITDENTAISTEKSSKNEVQRLLDLAIQKQKNYVEKEDRTKRTDTKGSKTSDESWSTKKHFQNEMKSSFRRDNGKPQGSEHKGPVKKSPTAGSSSKENAQDGVLRTKVEKAMKQKIESESDSKKQME